METENINAASMADYEDELNASLKKLSEGDLVTGTVISVTEDEVMLDLQSYAEGIIPASEYSREPDFSVKESVSVGEEVTAAVTKMDDGHGNILLSKVKANDTLAWEKLNELRENKTVLDVTVKGIVKSGVVAYVEGIRGFIPASKLALGYVEDTNPYLNQQIQVRVFEVDREKKRLILSAREILREKAAEERRQRISNVEVGLVTEGTIETIKPYGAFVNLGNGLSGLVHVSQICDRRIKTPDAVVKVGDVVKVKVIAVKDGKLSLSMKAVNNAVPEEIEEESYDLPETGAATTNLGSLFANIKLD